MPPLPMLTPRERDVVALIIEGLTYQEIARRLGIKRPTVDCHVQRIKGKIGRRGKAQFLILTHGPDMLAEAA